PADNQPSWWAVIAYAHPYPMEGCMPRFKTQKAILYLYLDFRLPDDSPPVAEANHIAYDPAQVAAVETAKRQLGNLLVELAVWSEDYRHQTKHRAKPDDYLTEHASEVRAALGEMEAATAALDRPEYHEPGHPLAPVFDRARAALQALQAI